MIPGNNVSHRNSLISNGEPGVVVEINQLGCAEADSPTEPNSPKRNRLLWLKIAAALAAGIIFVITLGVWFTKKNAAVAGVHVSDTPDSPVPGPIHVPYNLRNDTPKDFWYPVPLTLPSGEQLRGKIWSSRCPRDVEQAGESPQYFLRNAKENELTRVIILIDEVEDMDYAKVPKLEEWYKSQGIKAERFPIKNLSVPTSVDATVTLVTRMEKRLRSGENLLIHCCGGSGRTGTVLLALYRKLGIPNALEELRKIKSTFVVTDEQRMFGESLCFPVSG